jgi:UDP-N-acetylenolpyruvoylglucosamine reductase
VRALIRHAQAVVHERFGAALETEVKLIRPDGGADHLPPPR